VKAAQGVMKKESFNLCTLAETGIVIFKMSKIFKILVIEKEFRKCYSELGKLSA